MLLLCLTPAAAETVDAIAAVAAVVDITAVLQIYKQPEYICVQWSIQYSTTTDVQNHVAPANNICFAVLML